MKSITATAFFLAAYINVVASAGIMTNVVILGEIKEPTNPSTLDAGTEEKQQKQQVIMNSPPIVLGTYKATTGRTNNDYMPETLHRIESTAFAKVDACAIPVTSNPDSKSKQNLTQQEREGPSSSVSTAGSYARKAHVNPKLSQPVACSGNARPKRSEL